MRKNNILKLTITVVVLLFCLSCFSSCSNSEGYLELEEDFEALQNENLELTNEIEQLKIDINDLTEKNSDLAAKVEEAAPWFELSEMEKQAEEERLAEERAKQEEEERLAAEQAAAEAEANELLGYDTGITYDQLARTPDSYKGEKVKFYGEVIQVIESGSETDLRIAIDGDYDCVILTYYDSSITATRVLEDDWITIYGVSEGLYTYQSTMGGNITVPLIQIEKIDQ